MKDNERKRWNDFIKRVSDNGKKRVEIIPFMPGKTLDEMVKIWERDYTELFDVGLDEYDPREVVYVLHYTREQGISRGWIKSDAKDVDWMTEVDKLNREGAA